MAYQRCFKGGKPYRKTRVFAGRLSPQAEDKLCKDFLNTIPLISLLGNKAMRPRHWMMLMQATGRSI